MLETKHHWLPVIMAVYLPVSFIITYSIAVKNDHVEPGFPYISDTGTRSPESCVFGQLTNIGAVLAGIIIYVRYRHCVINCGNTVGNCLIRLNTAAFITGILTVVGVSLVGNFQQTNVRIVHLLGAFLAFFIGWVYMILQTVISYKFTACSEHKNTLCVRIVRVVLCVADAILLIVFVISDPISKSKGPGPGKSKQLWGLDDPGYAEHLVASISEWLVAFVTVIYFATFYTEFKHFRMESPEVVYYTDHQTSTDIETPVTVS